MNPLLVLNKYHDPSAETYRILTAHSILVARLALDIGARVKDKHDPDMNFLYEAAMLHDIGYTFPRAEEMFAGKFAGIPRTQYALHGFYGAELLREEGLARHARVAESHVGVGLTKEDVVRAGWPIPEKDYVPEMIEEKIIAYADSFYSKRPDALFREESKSAIREELGRFGSDKVRIFDDWDELFQGA